MEVSCQPTDYLRLISQRAEPTFAVLYFFSVPVTAPLLCAAFSALLPLIVVSRSEAPGPRTLLPILVTLFQSSLMVPVFACRGCSGA